MRSKFLLEYKTAPKPTPYERKKDWYKTWNKENREYKRKWMQNKRILDRLQKKNRLSKDAIVKLMYKELIVLKHQYKNYLKYGDRWNDTPTIKDKDIMYNLDGICFKI